jgi:hypothetical protein
MFIIIKLNNKYNINYTKILSNTIFSKFIKISGGRLNTQQLSLLSAPLIWVVLHLGFVGIVAYNF